MKQRRKLEPIFTAGKSKYAEAVEVLGVRKQECGCGCCCCCGRSIEHRALAFVSINKPERTDVSYAFHNFSFSVDYFSNTSKESKYPQQRGRHSLKVLFAAVVVIMLV